jgi:hypothetical protein
MGGYRIEVKPRELVVGYRHGLQGGADWIGGQHVGQARYGMGCNFSRLGIGMWLGWGLNTMRTRIGMLSSMRMRIGRLGMGDN